MNTTLSTAIPAWTARSKVVTLVLGLLTALNATAGQTELAAAIGETRTEVIRDRDQLQATVNAIDALAKQKGGDMRPTFDAFVAEIAKTEASAATTKARLEKMQADASTHFNTWQKDVDAIANEKLRAKAQKRMNDVQKSYDKVIAALQNASKRFTPLLSDMEDIKKTLANDLTPSGVKSIRQTVSQAKWDLKFVRSSMYDAIEELGKMEKSLGTIAPSK